MCFTAIDRPRTPRIKSMNRPWVTPKSVLNWSRIGERLGIIFKLTYYSIVWCDRPGEGSPEKSLSPIKVLFRTTLTRTITLHDRLSLPGSNPLLYYILLYLGMYNLSLICPRCTVQVLSIAIIIVHGCICPCQFKSFLFDPVILCNNLKIALKFFQKIMTLQDYKSKFSQIGHLHDYVIWLQLPESITLLLSVAN